MTRVVHCADAIDWLRANAPVPGASIITSLPDVSELAGLTIAQWSAWFTDAAELCLRAIEPDAIAVFYQTDAKLDGQWIDKAALVRDGALRVGARCLFHRVVLRERIASRSRAGYSHLIAFSQRATLDLSVAPMDVIADPGPTTWTRGMGAHACRAACEAVVQHTRARTILDPFCGHGTVLAIANGLGLDAIGVEIGRRRAKRARALTIEALLSCSSRDPDDEPSDDRSPHG